MSKKVLMGAGLVLVAYLAYTAYLKKMKANKMKAEREAVKQEAVASTSARLAGKQTAIEGEKSL